MENQQTPTSAKPETVMMTQLPEKIADNIGQFTGRAWILQKILDWLENTQERLFLIVGKPGSGKSMVSAWLAGAGPPPAEVNAAKLLNRVRASVGAVHFCRAANFNSPREFAQNVAEQLARVVKGFADHVVSSVSDRAKVTIINADLTVGTAQTGSRITGVELHLDLGSLTDDATFDRVLRAPLDSLYSAGYSGRILVIVDALDEALNYRGTNIVQMLRRIGGLPRSCRFLATTRDDLRVLGPLLGAPSLNLTDEPKDQDSILQYSYELLSGIDSVRRLRLAERITEAAQGQFLYAHLLLKGMGDKLATDFDPDKFHLPAGLIGFYRENLEREIAVDRGLWFDSIRAVLGLATVAQGDGLTRKQLRRVCNKDVDRPLEILGQYLEGNRPDGPFRLFHKSLGDYVVEQNLIDASQSHSAIARFYQELRNGTPAWQKWDPYGLLYVPTHLAESARSDEAANPDRVEELLRLVLDPSYQAEHKQRTGDLARLQLDLQLAVRAAASCESERAVPLVVEAALGLASFRKNELRPEPLFELAKQGHPSVAARRADLFDLSPDWRRAVRLIFAWLAVGVSNAEANSLRDTTPNKEADPTLATLIARLDTALGRQPLPSLQPLPPPRDEFFMQALVERIAGGGAGANTELLTSELYLSRGLQPPSSSDHAGKFLAEEDGPLLVSFAAGNPVNGDRFLRQYLSTHTGYQYVHYRQASLWVLLGSILRHPDQSWVREMLVEVGVSALAGTTAEFQEALPTAVSALQALAGKPGAQQAFLERTRSAIQDARNSAGGMDSWGFNKRRLTALVQASTLLPGGQSVMSELLVAAGNLAYGFAGFQSPACLSLAEAIHICGQGKYATENALNQALQAAHNIQDESFCARQTARVNAMRGWWQPSGFEVVKLASRLLEDPLAPDFATKHIVGERYLGRAPGSSRIPDPRTLKDLSDLYHQPIEEFVRVNGQRWAPLEPLQEADEVKVPDPGFATQLTARVSAEALIQPGLTNEERTSCIRRLIPLASLNATVLDTVLARLLIAAKPKGASLDTIKSLGGSISEPPPTARTVRLPS